MEQADSAVTKLETEIADMERKMAAGAVDDELLKNYGEVQKRLEEAMVEWEKATVELERIGTKS